jgi:hypothetical protein
MGFNPFRGRVNRTSDVAIVVVALAITVALVIWALFG